MKIGTRFCLKRNLSVVSELFFHRLTKVRSSYGYRIAVRAIENFAAARSFAWPDCKICLSVSVLTFTSYCFDGRFEDDDIRTSLNFQDFIYHDCTLEQETILTQNGSFLTTVNYAGTNYELVYNNFEFLR